MMGLTKKSAANLFYVIAIIVNLIGLGFNLYVHAPLMLDGKGFGSFSVIWTGLYLTIGAVLWLLGFLMHRDKWRSIAILILTLIPVILYCIFPVKFYFD